MTSKLRDRIVAAAADDSPVSNGDADSYATEKGLTRSQARERIRRQRRSYAVARARAAAVRDSYEASRGGLSAGDPLSVAARSGEVRISNLVYEETPESVVVDVRLAGVTTGGETHFRIVNPPTLVPDDAGNIVVGGRVFREDPLAALVAVIAQYGGTVKDGLR